MPTPVAANGQPFVIVQRLTRIAMAFTQPGMIADEVCPRVQVPGELFEYTKVNEKERLQIPDTKIGRTSAANQVDFSSANEQDRVEDHGLEAPVPRKDIDTARDHQALDPLDQATMSLMELMYLGREKEVADLVTTAANYATGHKLTLDGASGKKYFDDTTDGTPLAQMEDAMDAMLVRPNTMVVDRLTLTKLKRHPEVVARIFPTAVTTSGQVTTQQLADALELDRILVGQAWYDTGKKGQAQSNVRMWGNALALLHINRSLSTAKTTLPTFAMTATLGTPYQAGQYFDPRRGVKGVEVVKVIDQRKALIAYQTAGYLFSSPRNPG
jgi:hypothetical protein